MNEPRKDTDMLGNGSIMSEGKSPGMTAFQSGWRMGVRGVHLCERENERVRLTGDGTIYVSLLIIKNRNSISNRFKERRRNAWMQGWMDGSVNGWMDE